MALGRRSVLEVTKEVMKEVRRKRWMDGGRGRRAKERGEIIDRWRMGKRWSRRRFREGKKIRNEGKKDSKVKKGRRNEPINDSEQGPCTCL